MFIHQVFLTQSLFYLQLVWKPSEKQKHLNSECFFIVIWLKVIFIYLACSVKILLIILEYFLNLLHIYIYYTYISYFCVISTDFHKCIYLYLQSYFSWIFKTFNNTASTQHYNSDSLLLPVWQQHTHAAFNHMLSSTILHVLWLFKCIER